VVLLDNALDANELERAVDNGRWKLLPEKVALVFRSRCLLELHPSPLAGRLLARVLLTVLDESS